MLESKAKIKITNFLRYFEHLGQHPCNRTEQELIKQFIIDTWAMIGHNEWGVGLANLLTNIYEIEFILDKTAIDLARDAINECGMEYKEWTFIEELVK